MRARSLVFGVVLVGIAACDRELPPTGQLVVYVTTDAPLPPAPGDALLPTDPPPLFDRLRIELMKPGESAPCDGCSRDFEIDRTTIDQGKASIGIVPRTDTPGYRARVRLFTARWALAGVPNPDSTIDVTVALPPIAEEGLTEVTVMLNTDDVAQQIGIDDPIAPQSGLPRSGIVGTWPGAQRIPCENAAKKGEGCIPGGAFWMGDTPRDSLRTDALVQQRIAILSPYFLGTTEVTVAAMRASKLAVANDPLDSCDVWTTDPGPNEDLPLSCVSWELARKFCKKNGGDLPTEAQFEYAAGATASRRFVWGDDIPTCADAVFGHTFQIGENVITGVCNFQGGQRPPGTGLRDRLLLPGADPREEIVDLAGNLSELALDDWSSLANGPCWSTGVTTDPLCNTKTTSHAVRGGDILNGGGSLRAVTRTSGGVADAGAGFRCARPDTP